MSYCAAFPGRCRRKSLLFKQFRTHRQGGEQNRVRPWLDHKVDNRGISWLASHLPSVSQYSEQGHHLNLTRLIHGKVESTTLFFSSYPGNWQSQLLYVQAINSSKQVVQLASAIIHTFCQIPLSRTTLMWLLNSSSLSNSSLRSSVTSTLLFIPQHQLGGGGGRDDYFYSSTWLLAVTEQQWPQWDARKGGGVESVLGDTFQKHVWKHLPDYKIFVFYRFMYSQVGTDTFLSSRWQTVEGNSMQKDVPHFCLPAPKSLTISTSLS